MSWECKVCGHVNLDSVDICEECGAFKEESAYDAIADENDEE